MATSNIFDLTDTWADSGTTYTAIKMDVTDTASAADSLLMDLQVGGTSILSVKPVASSDPDNLVLYTGDSLFGGMTLRSAAGKFFSIRINNTAGAYLRHSTDLVCDNGGVEQYRLGGTTGLIAARVGFTVGSTSDTLGVRLEADATNTLAQRRSTSPQTFNLYNTYTDASNYERLAITGNAITVESAGTGAANIDLALVPAGTGNVKFGAHSSIGAETVTGYITIKDSGGTTRKLAVVS